MGGHAISNFDIWYQTLITREDLILHWSRYANHTNTAFNSVTKQ